MDNWREELARYVDGLPENQGKTEGVQAKMDRTLRRARRGAARLRELNERVLESKRHEVEMAGHRVQDVEDWIRIVQTRTQAIELLRRRFWSDAEVAAFLEEIDSCGK